MYFKDQKWQESLIKSGEERDKARMIELMDEFILEDKERIISSKESKYKKLIGNFNSMIVVPLRNRDSVIGCLVGLTVSDGLEFF